MTMQELSQKEGISFYPPHLWGLNYYFQTFCKLYIYDVLKMPEYSMFPGAFAYKNHPVYKVDIVGVVVKVEERAKCFIYAVDDGTGVVPCCCWKNYSNTNQGNTEESLHPTLRQKAQELTADQEEITQGYHLGDLVQIKGKIKIFRNQKEVVALYHNRLSNPMLEVTRMAELPNIFCHCYDRPFVLPHKVATELAVFEEEEKSGVKSQKRLIRDLKDVLLDHFHTTTEIELSAPTLLHLDALQPILLQCSDCDKDTGSSNDSEGLNGRLSVVLQALGLLEDEGIMCRRCDINLGYEIQLHNSRLDEHVVKILQTECLKAQYSEKGCHYFHILDELHRTLQYAKVKQSSLLYCLHKLESQSDVIRTTQSHYIPCSI